MSLSIKDALLNGTSEEELRKNFEKQMAIAKKELAENEQKKRKEQKDAINKARTKLINIFMEYLTILDAIPEDEDRASASKEVEAWLKAMEEELLNLSSLNKRLDKLNEIIEGKIAHNKKTETGRITADSILEAFLNMIC